MVGTDEDDGRVTVLKVDADEEGTDPVPLAGYDGADVEELDVVLLEPELEDALLLLAEADVEEELPGPDDVLGMPEDEVELPDDELEEDAGVEDELVPPGAELEEDPDAEEELVLPGAELEDDSEAEEELVLPGAELDDDPVTGELVMALELLLVLVTELDPLLAGVEDELETLEEPEEDELGTDDVSEHEPVSLQELDEELEPAEVDGMDDEPELDCDELLEELDDVMGPVLEVDAEEEPPPDELLVDPVGYELAEFELDDGVGTDELAELLELEVDPVSLLDGADELPEAELEDEDDPGTELDEELELEPVTGEEVMAEEEELEEVEAEELLELDVLLLSEEEPDEL